MTTASPFSGNLSKFRQRGFGLPPAPPTEAPIETASVGLEAAGETAEENADGERTAKISAGYVAPDQHCSTCTYCDESSTCTLYGFTCDPEGGCPDHEPGEASEAVAVEVEEPAEAE